MEDNLQDPYEYEVDLRDYITVLWEQKWLIIAIFVLAVGLAGFYSMRQPSVYSTEVTLLITPRVSEQIIKRKEGGITSVSLPPLAYERASMAADMVEKIIKDLDLENSQGEPISVASLKGSMVINVVEKNREAANGNTVKIPMITMTVKGQKPERLKKVANKWAELFKQRITELFASETARSFEFISRRFSEVQKKLTKLEKEKLDYKKEHPINVLKSEVKVLKNTYEDFLSSLEKKQATLASKKARLESLNESLNEEQKFLEPSRSIPEENLWSLLKGLRENPGTGADEGDGAKKLGALADFKIIDQEINETYLALREEKARVQADVASIEAEVHYLKNQVKKFGNKINEKQAKINSAEMQLQKLEREISRLNSTYNTLSSNLEEARIAKEEKESSTRIMQKAVAPEQPLPTDTKQNVAVAGVLGLFIGVLAAFFRNYMQEYEEEEDEAEEDEEVES